MHWLELITQRFFCANERRVWFMTIATKPSSFPAAIINLAANLFFEWPSHYVIDYLREISRLNKLQPKTNRRAANRFDMAAMCWKNYIWGSTASQNLFALILSLPSKFQHQRHIGDVVIVRSVCVPSWIHESILLSQLRVWPQVRRLGNGWHKLFVWKQYKGWLEDDKKWWKPEVIEFMMVTANVCSEKVKRHMVYQSRKPNKRWRIR